MGNDLTGGSELLQAVFGEEAKRQPRTDEYKKDGLIYCAICNEPKQATSGGFLHPALCACERKKKAEREAAEAQQRHAQVVKHRISACFGDNTKYRACTFDGCRAGVNEKTRQFLYDYCTNWQTMQKENIGLILCGGVGRGKTHLAACMCNKLIEDYETKAKLITENEFIERYSSIGDREKYMQELAGYSFLVLDEFGVQALRQNMTPTGYLPFLEDLINRRYMERAPLVITTNLSKCFFTKPQNDIITDRIQSRLTEMAASPVLFTGKDLRAEIQKEKIESIKQKLHNAAS